MADQQPTNPDLDGKNPWRYVGGLAVFCALPGILSMLGVSFASVSPGQVKIAIDAAATDGVEPVFQALGGSYTHTILEVGASVVALLTVVLAFTHYAVKRDVVAPVVAVALFWSGAMDAFHTLAADRLIDGNAAASDLIPFTWAICRTFNAVIPVTVLGMLIFMRRHGQGSEQRRSLGPVAIASFVLGVVAYFTIHWCATSDSLPQTMYPDAFITRPFDVLPLVVYFVSGFIIYPRFMSKTKSYFALALWLSVIPDFATQMYMAFGSTALFDSNFNIAHALKILAYMVPMAGLLVDYVKTYQRVEKEVQERTRAEKRSEAYALELEVANLELSTTSARLELEAKSLMQSNEQLDEFCYIASHDLREPLRGIHNYATFLLEDYGSRLDEDGRKKLETLPKLSKRLDLFIDSLLAYSRVGRTAAKHSTVDLHAVIQDVKTLLAVRIEESGATISIASDLPKVVGVPTGIEQIFSNLLSNAMKYSTDKPVIRIGWEESDKGIVFSVSDQGIGIREKHQDTVFRIFKRLHARDKYGGGAGAGLTIVKKIVHAHNGEIWVESEYGHGTTFKFYLGKGDHEHITATSGDSSGRGQSGRLRDDTASA